MIKFNSENGELLISGSVIDLSIESLAFIRSVYRSIGEDNKEAAEVYKDFFDKMIKSAFLSSEEIDRQVEEAIEELLNLMKKELNDKSESNDALHDEFERFLHEED